MTTRLMLGAAALASAALVVASAPAVAQAAPRAKIDNPTAQCAALQGTSIRANKLGTPDMLRGEATITKATHMAAQPAVLTPDLKPVTNAGNSSAVRVAAKPDFCQVTGTIAAVTAGAQPIGFQINLPDDWNGSSVQFGGGGFNGVLPDASDAWRLSQTAGNVESPLKRGYMTLSTDSGHLTAKSPNATSSDPVRKADATFDFALNEEMWRNFATDAYKKVHDLGEEVAKQHYGRKPAKALWMGSSEGGREGLLMAQRFPKDFDGIFARVPVIGWTGLFHNFIATVQAEDRNGRAGGFTPEAIDLVATATAATCDARDGIEDGVISDYTGCQDDALRAIEDLRCDTAGQTGCLNDAQIRVLETVFTPLPMQVDLPSGLTEYPGFLVGGEAWSLASKVGADPDAKYGDPTYPNYGTYGQGAAKYVFAQDPNLDVVNDYDPTDHRARVQQVSADMDTLDPDLSQFYRHGGKLIVQECTSDYAQSASMGMQYYDSVVQKMGQRTVDKFFKLYVSPGNDHGCTGIIDPATLDSDGETTYGSDTSAGTVNGVPRNIDWLTILEGWIFGGTAPGNYVIATTNEVAPPFGVLASKPVCHYPLYPRYVGGDAAKAESYACVK